jgi:probable HAF family extracellular repeat protein
MTVLQRCAAACMSAAVLLGAVSAGAAPYVYTELRSSGGTNLFGINTSGTVIGYSNANYPSFIYADGTYTTLNYPLANAYNTFAYGINDAGTVVGSYAIDNVAHGFLYANGVFTTFDVPGALNTGLSGINDAGTLWGSYDSHSFVDQGGVITTDPFGGRSVAGINDFGVVDGTYTDSAGSVHGFVYSNGVYTTIDVPGASDTHLLGINDAGELVGFYDVGCCSEFGFVYNDGIFTQIVEPMQVPGTFTDVSGISNSGAIVGSYLGFGPGVLELYGFIGTPTSPVPEPITLSLFGAGLVGTIAMRRRREKT